MSSTNDGKDVKSNQTSSQKGKTYYIELYKTLETKLNGESELAERTGHLCEAWRAINTLCQHATPTTHPHLLSWVLRHTARTILQSEWQSPKSKDAHTNLRDAIDAFIQECQSAVSKRGNSQFWESQLLQRAEWFKSVLTKPWDHPVLKALLNPSGEPPSDEEVLKWLKEERSVMFVTRLRQLVASKCDDLALSLASAVMDRARAVSPANADDASKDKPSDKSKEKQPPTFVDILKTQAGFNEDLWEIVTDIEFVLLHKLDRSRCIELAKQTPLDVGYKLVERLRNRLENSPREKKLWKNSKDVATVITQMLIARCMVVPLCTGVPRATLYCCTRSLARLVSPQRLRAETYALAALAATARHLHTFAAAVDAQCESDMKPFVCELYIRAITAGMNELERLKLKTEKESEARSTEQTLASWFTQLGDLLSPSARMKCECTLTAFSVHPSQAMYDRIKAAPVLPPVGGETTESNVTTSEFGSWANDSQSQTNFVKTSQTLNLKHTQKQANVLSTAILTEGEAIGLGAELCQDLAVLLSGPRLKTLTWDMNRELLLENCRTYMEKTHGGTRAVTKELKYLNLDPKAFEHLPEEEEDENDIYYGIEKGYEHLVEVTQEPEEIWQDTLLDSDREDSSSSSSIDEYPIRRNKKSKKYITSDEDSDPLRIADLRNCENKKDLIISRENKQKSKFDRDSSQEKEKNNKDKQEKKKQKKERKNLEKSEKQKLAQTSNSLSSFIGMKVIKIEDGEKNVCKKKERRRKDKQNIDRNVATSITDSDYDSQGKSSLTSLNSEENESDVLVDGLFFMDELNVTEKTSGSNFRNANISKNSELSVSNGQVALNGVPRDKTKADLSRTEPLCKKTPVSKKANSTRKTSTNFSQTLCSSGNIQVNKDVANSIKKLLQFRRQMNKASERRKVPDSQSTKIENGEKQVNLMPLNSRVDNPPSKSIQKCIKLSEPNREKSDSSKNILTNSVPTSCHIANPTERITDTTKPVPGNLYLGQSVRREEKKDSATPTLGKQISPQLKYPMKIINKIEPKPENATGILKQHIGNTSIHFGKAEPSLTKSKTAIFTKSTQNNDIKKVYHQNSFFESKDNLEQGHYQPPGNIKTYTKNLHESYQDYFIKQLQRNLDITVTSDRVTNTPVTKKKDSKPVHTQMSFASNLIKKRADIISPPCAKGVAQPNKLDVAPNTFARLSYMHKSKQSENKEKPTTKILDSAPLDLKIDKETELNQQITDRTLYKMQYLQKKGLAISRLDGSIQKEAKEPQSLKSGQNTKHTLVKENPILCNMLDKKINKPNNRNDSLQTINNIYQTSKYTTAAHADKQPVQISDKTWKNTSLSEKDQQDLILLLRQQSKLNAPVSLLNTSNKNPTHTHSGHLSEKSVNNSVTNDSLFNKSMHNENCQKSKVNVVHNNDVQEGAITNASMEMANLLNTSKLCQYNKMADIPKNMRKVEANIDVPNKYMSDDNKLTEPILNNVNVKYENVKHMYTVNKEQISNKFQNINTPAPILHPQEDVPKHSSKNCPQVSQTTMITPNNMVDSLKGDTKVLSKNGISSQQCAKYGNSKHQDWEKVMNAILAQKTPCRSGPSELEIALRKDTQDKRPSNKTADNAIDMVQKDRNSNHSLRKTISDEGIKKPLSKISYKETKTITETKSHKQGCRVESKNMFEKQSGNGNVTASATVVSNESGNCQLTKHRECNPSSISENNIQTIFQKSQFQHIKIKKNNCLQNPDITISTNINKYRVMSEGKSAPVTKMTLKSEHRGNLNLQNQNNPLKRSSPLEMFPLESRKKQPIPEMLKEIDPFISGIPNSDYDLLEELMDDDLRQEIGELSSDEETYHSSCASNLQSKHSMICSTDKTPIVNNKCTLNDTYKQSNKVKKISLTETSKLERKSQLKSDSDYLINISNRKTKIDHFDEEPKTGCDIDENITVTHCINENETQLCNNKAVEIDNRNNLIEPPKLFITAVPRQTSLQNVVLIAPDVVYNPCSIKIKELPVNANLFLNQNAYVAVNSTPNLALFQTTQLTTTTVNPVLVRSAITVPITGSIVSPSMGSDINKLPHAKTQNIPLSTNAITLGTREVLKEPNKSQIKTESTAYNKIAKEQIYNAIQEKKSGSKESLIVLDNIKSGLSSVNQNVQNCFKQNGTCKNHKEENKPIAVDMQSSKNPLSKVENIINVENRCNKNNNVQNGSTILLGAKECVSSNTEMQKDDLIDCKQSYGNLHQDNMKIEENKPLQVNLSNKCEDSLTLPQPYSEYLMSNKSICSKSRDEGVFLYVSKKGTDTEECGNRQVLKAAEHGIVDLQNCEHSSANSEDDILTIEKRKHLKSKLSKKCNNPLISSALYTKEMFSKENVYSKSSSVIPLFDSCQKSITEECDPGNRPLHNSVLNTPNKIPENVVVDLVHCEPLNSNIEQCNLNIEKTKTVELTPSSKCDYPLIPATHTKHSIFKDNTQSKPTNVIIPLLDYNRKKNTLEYDLNKRQGHKSDVITPKRISEAVTVDLMDCGNYESNIKIEKTNTLELNSSNKCERPPIYSASHTNSSNVNIPLFDCSKKTNTEDYNSSNRQVYKTPVVKLKKIPEHSIVDRKKSALLDQNNSKLNESTSRELNSLGKSAYNFIFPEPRTNDSSTKNNFDYKLNNVNLVDSDNKSVISEDALRLQKKRLYILNRDVNTPSLHPPIPLMHMPLEKKSQDKKSKKQEKYDEVDNKTDVTFNLATHAGASLSTVKDDEKSSDFRKCNIAKSEPLIEQETQLAENKTRNIVIDVKNNTTQNKNKSVISEKEKNLHFFKDMENTSLTKSHIQNTCVETHDLINRSSLLNSVTDVSTNSVITTDSELYPEIKVIEQHEGNLRCVADKRNPNKINDSASEIISGQKMLNTKQSNSQYNSNDKEDKPEDRIFLRSASRDEDRKVEKTEDRQRDKDCVGKITDLRTKEGEINKRRTSMRISTKKIQNFGDNDVTTTKITSFNINTTSKGIGIKGTLDSPNKVSTCDIHLIDIEDEIQSSKIPKSLRSNHVEQQKNGKETVHPPEIIQKMVTNAKDIPLVKIKSTHKSKQTPDLVEKANDLESANLSANEVPQVKQIIDTNVNDNSDLNNDNQEYSKTIAHKGQELENAFKIDHKIFKEIKITIDKLNLYDDNLRIHVNKLHKNNSCETSMVQSCNILNSTLYTKSKIQAKNCVTDNILVKEHKVINKPVTKKVVMISPIFKDNQAVVTRQDVINISGVEASSELLKDDLKLKTDESLIGFAKIVQKSNLVNNFPLSSKPPEYDSASKKKLSDDCESNGSKEKCVSKEINKKLVGTSTNEGTVEQSYVTESKSKNKPNLVNESNCKIVSSKTAMLNLSTDQSHSISVCGIINTVNDDGCSNDFNEKDWKELNEESVNKTANSCERDVKNFKESCSNLISVNKPCVNNDRILKKSDNKLNPTLPGDKPHCSVLGTRSGIRKSARNILKKSFIQEKEEEQKANVALGLRKDLNKLNEIDSDEILRTDPAGNSIICTKLRKRIKARNIERNCSITDKKKVDIDTALQKVEVCSHTSMDNKTEKVTAPDVCDSFKVQTPKLLKNKSTLDRKVLINTNVNPKISKTTFDNVDKETKLSKTSKKPSKVDKSSKKILNDTVSNSITEKSGKLLDDGDMYQEKNVIESGSKKKFKDICSNEVAPRKPDVKYSASVGKALDNVLTNESVETLIVRTPEKLSVTTDETLNCASVMNTKFKKCPRNVKKKTLKSKKHKIIAETAILEGEVGREVSKKKKMTEDITKTKEYLGSNCDLTKQNVTEVIDLVNDEVMIPMKVNIVPKIPTSKHKLENDKCNCDLSIDSDFKNIRDSIKIQELSTQDSDPLKRTILIKLPDGKTFKASVFGKLDINFDTLFADPQMKSLLLKSIKGRKRYTLNIKQATLQSNTTEIQTKLIQPKPIDTVDLISDDEGELTKSLNTECSHGTNSLDDDALKKIQNNLDQNSSVSLDKVTARNTTPTSTKDINLEHLQNIETLTQVVDSLASPDNKSYNDNNIGSTEKQKEQSEKPNDVFSNHNDLKITKEVVALETGAFNSSSSNSTVRKESINTLSPSLLDLESKRTKKSERALESTLLCSQLKEPNDNLSFFTSSKSATLMTKNDSLITCYKNVPTAATHDLQFQSLETSSQKTNENDSEIIEIDDSSNDSVKFKSIDNNTDDNLPDKTICELKNLLLQELGIDEIKQSVEENNTEHNQANLHNEKKCLDANVMKNCFVQLVRCDSLVSHILNTTVCHETVYANPNDNDVYSSSDDSSHSYVEDVKSLSRCDSFSILNDFALYDNIGSFPQTEKLHIDGPLMHSVATDLCNFTNLNKIDETSDSQLSKNATIYNMESISEIPANGRTSPLMEILDKILHLTAKSTFSNNIQSQNRFPYDSSECDSEWHVTKQSLCFKGRVIQHSFDRLTINTNESPYFINKKDNIKKYNVPRLVTMISDYFANGSIIDTLLTFRQSANGSPIKTFKRKMITGTGIAYKVRKIEDGSNVKKSNNNKSTMSSLECKRETNLRFGKCDNTKLDINVTKSEKEKAQLVEPCDDSTAEGKNYVNTKSNQDCCTTKFGFDQNIAPQGFHDTNNVTEDNKPQLSEEIQFINCCNMNNKTDIRNEVTDCGVPKDEAVIFENNTQSVCTNATSVINEKLAVASKTAFGPLKILDSNSATIKVKNIEINNVDNYNEKNTDKILLKKNAQSNVLPNRVIQISTSETINYVKCTNINIAILSDEQKHTTTDVTENESEKTNLNTNVDHLLSNNICKLEGNSPNKGLDSFNKRDKIDISALTEEQSCDILKFENTEEMINLQNNNKTIFYADFNITKTKCGAKIKLHKNTIGEESTLPCDISLEHDDKELKLQNNDHKRATHSFPLESKRIALNGNVLHEVDMKTEKDLPVEEFKTSLEKSPIKNLLIENNNENKTLTNFRNSCNVTEETTTKNDDIRLDIDMAKTTITNIKENSSALIYKYDKNVILKGVEYEDPVVGTCYVFPIVVASDNSNSHKCLNTNNLSFDAIINTSQSSHINTNSDSYELNEYILKQPNATYSRGSLKRKIDIKQIRGGEKKYRKGKNIDYPKFTAVAISESAYSKEYKIKLDYYSSLKFSYSRSFHKEFINVPETLTNWPIHGNPAYEPPNEIDNNLFNDIEETENYEIKIDSERLTLSEEISSNYNEGNKLATGAYENISMNMGFGEGSDRAIQNLGEVNDETRFSAATLSDVKQPQPFLVSENNNSFTKNFAKETSKDQIEKIRRYLAYIKLRDKVRSFFKKTRVELSYDWIKEQSKDENIKSDMKFCKRSLPFELCKPDFIEKSPMEAVVQVVQVGQLPVSAAAQNPVTCDPRVTQVSDVSPQFSAENSPQDESQTIKNEYTELTNADLTLPLVHEYTQQNQTIIVENQGLRNTSNDSDIRIESEIKPGMPANIIEQLTVESRNLPSLANVQTKTVHYHYDRNSLNALEATEDFEGLDENNSDTEKKLQQRNHNGSKGKTDQIAHAMNAAGITTSPENLSNSRSHALVNILTQKIRHGVVNTGQNPSVNYPKVTSINAMALQQALAQILPPPLNDTNPSENNQQLQNASVTPQVLHIVQGKSNSSNQITLVDNSQPTVISAPNTAQVLHIVQNKSAVPTSNGPPISQTNSFSGISLVDAGLQQGGNQLLHIVNTGNQKNNNPGHLLKRVNLLTNLTNVQGSNEQKMVQFVCKSADGKPIQLNTTHQRSMVLRLQPIESNNLQTTPPKSVETEDSNPTSVSNSTMKESSCGQQEIKSRSVYEENYAKFIQNSSNRSVLEKSTSLPKFNQVFGKSVFQEDNQKQNEINSNNAHLSPTNNASTENTECEQSENIVNMDHIAHINSPPLLLRKSPASSSQSQANLVQQIKQSIAPMNIQTMHGGVIYTRQIPVNIGGGQTINLITVPSTELIEDSNPKQQEVKFVNQNDIEPSIIKIVPQATANTEISSEEGANQVTSNENTQTSSSQPVLTQMRIKLPMLSKTPQMVPGARVIRPSFFQIQRNVIGGVNQPVYQQLVLTAAPPLGQQTIRIPNSQTNRVKVPADNQSENQMSSSTLEQLREFDMVLEQVKERSTVQPTPNSNSSFNKIHVASTDCSDGTLPMNTVSAEPTQQIFYSVGNSQSLNVAYVNRKATVTTPVTSSFVRSPDSSGMADSPTSSTNVHHTISADAQNDISLNKSIKVGSKSKSRPKSSSNPANSLKINTVPPKTSTQKPLEDEQTTQRILYILAEYKEQVENSPDKDKPAPRRRSNPPSNPSGSSKRKKNSSSSKRPNTRDVSPVHGEDTCRTMGSEDSSCGTSQGECAENCLDAQSPQDSPRKVARKLTFENETQPSSQPRPQPQRNVIVADGQTITVARGTAGKPATAVLMPANYILPVSMVKGGQQIAIVTNRGPKILAVGAGEGGSPNTLLLQRLIGPAGLKPILTRPGLGVRHVRLPTAALHNLQTINLTPSAPAQPPDSTASPTPATPDPAELRPASSPWPEREQDAKQDRSSSPEGSEPWNLQASAEQRDYSYEETRSETIDRTVLDSIPDRYSPDMEAQRIFDKMFDVDSKKSYIVDSHDDSSRCIYDIDASDCEEKPYHQVVHKREGTSRQHRLTHVSAAALRHKYAILEHELRLQKSLSEECEDLGVDSPSASELFPEAELLFAASPAHDHAHDQTNHSHTPQPTLMSQSGIPQPDLDDQIATDHLIRQTTSENREDLNVNLGLEDVGIVTVSKDGMQATLTLDHEEFARSHPNTTFHSEPTEGELQPFTITGLKGRTIGSTIFHHANSAPATVLMTAPQTTVISQAAAETSGIQNTVKYADLNNIINSLPNPHGNDINLSSVLVKDDGLTRYDNILTDSRDLHLSNTASAIVHSVGNATQVIRRVCYDDDKRERDARFLLDEPDKRDRDTRFIMDEPDAIIAGNDAKLAVEDSSRDATLESMPEDDDRSSPEQHAELFWESNSASEKSESRRPLDFSSDSDKCCKSPSFDETNSTDSSGLGSHMRLDSVIKEARGRGRSASGDGSSADDTHPPLRTYPPKRMFLPIESEMGRSTSGKTRAGERSPDSLEVRRRASGRGVVKRGCHCCNGSPIPPRPKKPRQRKPTMDFSSNI